MHEDSCKRLTPLSPGCLWAPPPAPTGHTGRFFWKVVLPSSQISSFLYRIMLTNFCFYKVSLTCKYTKGFVVKEIQIEIIIFKLESIQAKHVTEFLSLM